VAKNWSGGMKVLSESFELLDTIPRVASELNVRSGTGNGVVGLSADGGVMCGFLTAGESRRWINTSPDAIYVMGKAGDWLFWDVSE